MAIGCGLLLALSPISASAQDVPEPITVVTGLGFPAGISFGPEGEMYFTERTGRVRVLTPEGKLDPEPVVEFQTTTTGETGALGMASADTPEPALYVFVTDPDGAGNRVVLVDVHSGTQSVVVDGIPGSGYHNGGGVVFYDGYLFISNGETHESLRSQEPDELGGKVYRFTPNGELPADNPFGDSPAWAIGLRNPYGMTEDPVSGDLFVTENGPESHDEVNHIERGGNYGWPDISGPAEDRDTSGFAGDYHDPLLDYPEIIVPTGIAIADPDAALPEYAGELFFGSFGEGGLHHVSLNGQRDRALEDEVLLTEEDGIVAVEWGPGGLYYSTPTSIKFLPLGRERAPMAAATETEGGLRGGRIVLVVGLLLVIGIAVVVLNRRVSNRET